MSYGFEQDFSDRKRQVRHYLAVVLATENSVLLGATSTDQGRLLTLRAGTFLVLYNLVESTLRAALDAIHDKIVTNSVEFGSLNEGLRKEVITRFKKHANPDQHHSPAQFPSAFVAVALDPEVKLAGNVDARLIRDFADVYGFSTQSNKAHTRDGSDLHAVRVIRNDLAHGRKTFETVGRDHPSQELLMTTRRSIAYLNAFVGHVTEYLDNERYLTTPRRAP